MNIVAYVPIKLNNERLPGKNIKLLNGRPLCSYLLETLLSVSHIQDVYVFCSDPTIIPYLPEGVHFLRRDSSLDSQQTTSNDLTRAFAAAVEADVYVLAHVTAPFLRATSISNAVLSVSTGGFDSAFSAVETQDFTWNKGVPNYDPKKIPRTQDLDSSYVETSGVYVFTRDLVLKHDRRVGDNPFRVLVSKIEAIDIDNPIDFQIAEAIASYGQF